MNLGVGWKAAVNFAYPEWREAAESVHQMYKKLEKATGQKRNYRCVPDFDAPEWRGDNEFVVVGSVNNIKRSLDDDTSSPEGPAIMSSRGSE